MKLYKKNYSKIPKFQSPKTGKIYNNFEILIFFKLGIIIDQGFCNVFFWYEELCPKYCPIP